MSKHASSNNVVIGRITPGAGPDQTEEIPIAELGGTVELADATSITPNSDYLYNFHENTQAAGTLTVNAPTGSPSEFHKLWLRIKSTQAHAISWNATYRDSGDITLPTALTGGGSVDYYGFIWNDADSAWDLLAYNRGF